MGLFNNNGRKEEKVKMLLAEWRDVKEEIKAATCELEFEKKRLELEIKKLVTNLGQAVTMDGAKAIYRRGYVRASWDTKALRGYAAVHPEILEFKKETQVKSSVSIRSC